MSPVKPAPSTVFLPLLMVFFIQMLPPKPPRKLHVSVSAGGRGSAQLVSPAWGARVTEGTRRGRHLSVHVCARAGLTSQGRPPARHGLLPRETSASRLPISLAETLQTCVGSETLLPGAHPLLCSTRVRPALWSQGSPPLHLLQGSPPFTSQRRLMIHVGPAVGGPEREQFRGNLFLTPSITDLVWKHSPSSCTVAEAHGLPTSNRVLFKQSVHTTRVPVPKYRC